MWRSLAVIAMVCALVSSAGAQPRHHHGGGKDWDHPRGPSYHDRAVSSFWGGVLGGLIGQAFRPGREGEDVEGDLEPWSKAWFAYCTDKYRSFDPRTGRYLGYDGDFHFCR